MSKIRQAVVYGVCIGIICVVSAFIAINSEPATRSDPDRYYHYAVSKVTSKEFAPETMPQIEGIGWSKFFQEKEFLFHVFTGAGYKIGGDKGVLVTCMLIGGLIILSIYFVNLQVLTPFAALIPTLLIAFASSKFLIRVFSVRPQILGVLFAILLLGALLQRRHRIAGLMSLLFALSYHAVYIPLVLAVIACLSSFAIERGLKGDLLKGSLKCLLYTAIGLTIGLLINPYFPSNVMMGIQHLKIAFLSAGLPISHFGAELISATGANLLAHLPGFILLLAVGFIALGYLSHSFLKTEKKPSLEKKDAYAAALTTFCAFALFLVLTFQSPRGNEYLVPFASLFIARLVQLSAHKTRMLAVLSIGLFILQIPDSRIASMSLAKSSEFFQPEAEPMMVRQALEGIPAGTEKNRVFNCSWDVSPFLLYTRPDLIFVDILDPSFLFSRQPDFYLARHQWFNGDFADSFGLLKDTFQTDYIFCRNLPISNRLKADPHFELIFPKTLAERLRSEFTVFALKPERPTSFVKQFLYREKLAAAESALANDGIKIWPGDISSDGPQPIFIDLKALAAPLDVDGGDIACTDVEPSPAEMDRLKGASIVGLGGGPHLQLWHDGKLIYGSVNFSAPRSILHSLVELSSPVAKETKIRVRICGARNSIYLGVALSFWTKESLLETCAARKNESYDYVPTENAEKLERSDIECLAPLVLKK